jgi:hypothetical protein
VSARGIVVALPRHLQQSQSAYVVVRCSRLHDDYGEGMKHKRVTCDQKIVVRIPSVLRDQLELAAAEERRTLADLTRNVLLDWVAEQASGVRAGVTP